MGEISAGTVVTIGEAQLQVRVGAASAEVSGPLALEWTIESDVPVFVGILTDRSRSRLADIWFTVSGVDGAADPRADAVDSGGPTGAVRIEPGSQLRQKVQLEDYLSLDRIRFELGGDTGWAVSLHCFHRIRAGHDAGAALARRDDWPVVELVLPLELVP